MLILVQLLAAKARELKGDSVYNLLCVNLGLQPESCIHVVTSLLFLIEYPTAAAEA